MCSKTILSFSATLALGVIAFMPSTAARAALPCGSAICTTWWNECGQGNQNACSLFRADCSGCPPLSTSSGTPPIKGNSKFKSDVAAMDSKQIALTPK